MEGTWKDGQAYLFNNGRFALRYRGRPCRIINFNPNINAFTVSNDFWEDDQIAYLSDETVVLLARPIRTITTQEWKWLDEQGLADFDGESYAMVDSSNTIIHLLALGVYPFDQLAFGTNHVANILDASKDEDQD